MLLTVFDVLGREDVARVAIEEGDDVGHAGYNRS